MLALRIRKPLERTPLGLPKWRLPNLEDEDWLMFEKHVLSQGSPRCTVCDRTQSQKTKMWTCKKCGDERAIRAIYCVREALYLVPTCLVSTSFCSFVESRVSKGRLEESQVGLRKGSRRPGSNWVETDTSYSSKASSHGPESD